MTCTHALPTGLCGRYDVCCESGPHAGPACSVHCDPSHKDIRAAALDLHSVLSLLLDERCEPNFALAWANEVLAKAEGRTK